MTSPLAVRRFSPKRYRPGNLGTWSGHLPFAKDLVCSLKPSLLVELGTHYGESYFGFCQAVRECGITCRCFAVDTWQGDEHAGFYGEEVYREVEDYNQMEYAAFSTLVRDTFDQASARFAAESIDLLHIDGLHTYAAVKHDFETWFSKVRPGGVVLLHDVNVRHADFEVWRFWEELARDYPSFSFHHCWGLGVLLKPGGDSDTPFLKLLFEADAETGDQVRERYYDAADLLDFRERSPKTAQAAADADRPYLQVFPARDDTGFVEKDSVVSNIEGGTWQEHVVELPHGAPGGAIRIDPVNRPAWIELSALTVRDGGGSTLVQMDTQQLAELGGLHELMPFAASDTPRFFSWGNDPQFVIEVPGTKDKRAPVTLTMTMRIGFSLEEVRDTLLAQRAATAVHGQLQADVGEWRAHATGLRATLTREENVRTRLEWDLTFLKTQVSDRGQTIKTLQKKLTALQTEVEQLHRQVAVKDAAMLNLQHLAAAQQARAEGLTESLSWRITAPLRSIAGSFLRE